MEILRDFILLYFVLGACILPAIAACLVISKKKSS
jgi:hypothetical protein